MTAGAPAWALEMLRHGRVARLATADVGGQPLVVPVCYALLDGLVYSAVDAKPKRTRSLRRLANVAVNPRVSLVVDHYDEDWTRLRWVMAEGVATVLTGGDDFARGIDALAAKYPQYLTLGLSRDSGAVIRIAPTRILSWRWSES